MRWRDLRSINVTVAAVVGLSMIVLAACGTPDPTLQQESVFAQQNDEEDADGPTGEILFVSDHNIMRWTNGDVTQVTENVYAASPTWAPVGDRFAYVQVHDGFSELIVADREGDPLEQVTDHQPEAEEYSEEYVFSAAWAWSPDWSPVAEQLIYASDKNGLDRFSRPLYLWFSEDWEIPPYALPASYSIGHSQEDPSFAPGGQQIAFTARVTQETGDRTTELWTLNLDSGVWEPRVAGTDGAYDPDWSPDGENIAYIQRDGESNDVWILPVDGGEPYQLTDVGAAAEPVWSPDGRYIAFMREVDGQFEVWTVELSTHDDGRVTASEPSHLISADNIGAQSGLSWIQH